MEKQLVEILLQESVKVKAAKENKIRNKSEKKYELYFYRKCGELINKRSECKQNVERKLEIK